MARAGRPDTTPNEDGRDASREARLEELYQVPALALSNGRMDLGLGWQFPTCHAHLT